MEPGTGQCLRQKRGPGLLEIPEPKRQRKGKPGGEKVKLVAETITQVNLDFQNTPTNFFGGKVSNNIDAWKKITKNDWVL